jgi:hypothetical protein
MPAVSGRYPSGQRGQTVNLLAYAFGGSNPPLPTMRFGPSAGDVDVKDASRESTGGNSSAVERQPSKLGVAGSNPVSRSMVWRAAGGWEVPPLAAANGFAHVAQLAEHALGKGEVSGSIPDMGSRMAWRAAGRGAAGPASPAPAGRRGGPASAEGRF